MYKDLFIIEGKKESRTKGAFIPDGSSIQLGLEKNNVLLIGDSAGLIDPITGEGIFLAIASGIKAGEAIVDTLSQGKNTCRTYVRSMQEYMVDIKSVI